MAGLRARPGEERPLVVVISSVPLVGQAAGSVLDFAEVRFFTSGGDTAGLLSWMRPDAVIVDCDADAEAAQSAAKAYEVPVVHIGLRDRTLRLLRHGKWRQIGNGEGPTPEAIRNAVAGSLFSRKEHL